MVVLITFLVIIVLVCLLAMMYFMWVILENMRVVCKEVPTKNIDYIVILGCISLGTKVSKQLQNRLDLALEIFNKNSDAEFVCTGSRKELSLMREYLESKVNNAPIITCYSSFGTWSGILMSSIETFDGDVILCTSDYHIARCRLVLRYLDLRYSIIACDGVNTPIHTFIESIKCFLTATLRFGGV